MGRVIVRTTATDNSGFFNLYALALSNGATAPSDGDEAKAWFDVGVGSNNVVGVGSQLSVPSGQRGTATIGGLTIGTNVDVFVLVGDSSGNYTLSSKYDVLVSLPELLVNIALDRTRDAAALRSRRRPFQRRERPFREMTSRLRRLTRLRTGHPRRRSGS